MDQAPSPTASRASGIPRPSRLPVPRSTLRPAASQENLQQSQRSGIVNPRLRSTPSRDQLSSTTSMRPRGPSTPSRGRDSSQNAVPRPLDLPTAANTPIPRISRRTSHDTLFRKPSQSFFAEPQAGRNLREKDDVVQEDSALVEESDEQMAVATRSQKPRPSLAERTMETLQNIPSSPAVRRRGSSFYGTENPMRPTSRGRVSSRPGSSHQGDMSMRPPSHSLSRPTSSAGPPPSGTIDFRASTNTFKPPQGSLSSHANSGRTNIGRLVRKPSNIQGSFQTPTTTANPSIPSPIFSASPRDSSPSPVKQTPSTPSVKAGTKSLASRSLRPRASANGLFRKPSITNMDGSNDIDRIGFGQKKKPATFSNSSSEGTSTTSKISTATTATSISNENNEAGPKKTSSALRDQIAKAKAAKRAASASAKQIPSQAPKGHEVPVIASGSFDFGLSDDPFNQHMDQKGIKSLLRKRIDAARTDGRLNIAAMRLKEIPEEVMNMYSLEASGAHGGSWAESVDLTRLIAADNELELFRDDIFPDVDPRVAAEDDDAQGNQFGGLETLDLHGNVLIALPIGLRRLELLTTLNIANNKLGNDCFEVISQLSSLRDLKIGNNDLSGPLDPRISGLQSLEVLDLQRNSLTALPEDLAELVRLRVLNVRENKLASLPFRSLRGLPLAELLASKNKLSGALIMGEVEEMPILQILDVACNSLTLLSKSGKLALPSLHQLDCSSNRLTELPNLTSWERLLTIAAEDNNISSIPDGFVNLAKLKNVDFNGNNIKILDDEIGGMTNLDVLRISGNPLRDKKFASMNTEDLKRALKARMAPADHQADQDADNDGAFCSANVSPISPRPASSDWPVKAGNILDRSNTQSHSLNPVAAAQVAANNNIKSLELHHNKFKEIPSSIAFFALTLTSLSLAHNELNGDSFMKDDLELPALKELNLSSNTFNSLQPLIQNLQAPQLEKLDISFNRLTSLPSLRQHFPNLVNLFASHNTIRELSPGSVKGLRILDCSSNDINSLNARIGLLGGPGGLERLDVSGNRFRVPKYTILEKGTEATLTWLRDRIPANEAAATDVD
ncbi:hypothetical protein BJ875DRAFT_406416 [Amylocarpus encephaloides]|uniref:Leucine-rich repeat-containing protein 40 n=1 Tax=Amylocarpus encephaloides TaxID=45428 RepID=A0A9P8C364_9HELO|nr:hypothetical protein BJ875DRAFT_406416 [Amylocarpus encephaloides]